MIPLLVFLEAIQKTVACTISVGHRFGISINMSEGKTEAIIHLVGPTAKETLVTLYTTRPPAAPRHLQGFLELHQGQHIRLVSVYKHLGMRAAPTLQSQRAQECQHIAASARQAFRALSAAVFASSYLSKKDRILIASACITTRSLHGAGTWEGHTVGSRRKHTWPPLGALSARALIWERSLSQMPLSAKSLALPLWTLLRQFCVFCILLVLSIMDPTLIQSQAGSQ